MNQASTAKKGNTPQLCGLFLVAGLSIIYVKGALIHCVVMKEKTAVGLFMHHMSGSFKEQSAFPNLL